MTSGPRLVKPHAIFWLWPITTPGSPAKEKPDTWKGHAVLTVRHWRLTCDQMLGIPSERWGSLASNGLPVVVREPDTTHEFDPMSSPLPRVAGTASTAAEARSTAACPDAVRRACGIGPAAWALGSAAGFQSSAERMGRLRSKG